MAETDTKQTAASIPRSTPGGCVTVQQNDRLLTMKTHLIRAAIAALGMFLCAVVGFFAPPLWQSTSGRDARPYITMAVLILILAVVLRRGFRWRVADFILGLVAAQVVIVAVIVYFADIFSGFTWSQLPMFMLQAAHSILMWLVFANAFIGLPWLLGFGLGSLWLWLSEKYADTRTDRIRRSQKEMP